MASDVQNFVEGTAYSAFKSVLPNHIKEQVELRKSLCKDCLEEGKCQVCHCKTPAMFYSPQKQDARNKWAEFMSEAQWNSLKNNINLYKQFFDGN